MGTNYYRIPKAEELLSKKETLLKSIQDLEITPLSIFNLSYADDNPWLEFVNGLNIHIGKRSSGWKFIWNFNNNLYYSNKEELFKFLRDGIILDEYGRIQETEEFIEMALNWCQPDGFMFNEEYAKRHVGYESLRYTDKIIDGLVVCHSSNFS